MDALDLIETMAGEIGPRRPTSRKEAAGAQAIVEYLRDHEVGAQTQRFRSYASFGYPVGAIALAALSPALMPRKLRRLRACVGLGAAALAVAEGSLRGAPVSKWLARRESRNVIAVVEPREQAERTLCLMAHCDTSRSGLLFHPRLAPHLQTLFSLPGAATVALAGAPLYEHRRWGRAVAGALRLALAGALVLVAERELMGEDVPGANDNASGAAVVAQLAAEAAAKRPRSTRLVVLVSGAEEAGVLGAQAFLDSHATEGWLFVNFDGVGAPATLRYLSREGIGRTWPADRALVRVAEAIRRQRPELGLEPADAPTGLIYDATAVLARGGRALTLVAADGGRIPNYHRPSDTVANLDPQAVARALEVGREFIAAADRGEADAP